MSTEEPSKSTDEAQNGSAGAIEGGQEGAEGTSEGEEGLDDARMTLLEHLQELRVRLRNAGIAFILATIVSFLFVEKFFQILVRPVVRGIKAAGIEKVKLQATSPTEGFWVAMKLALIGGIIVAAPLVFWELWKFVAPGLYKKEKRIALMVTGATGLCFTAGAVFGYFVLAEPAGYFLTKMLTSFGGGGQEYELAPEYRIENVADFLMMTLGGCGLAFELPVVITMIGGLGMVSARGLWKFNKYALILSAVVGAVLTPSPDPFNQMALAGPLFVLYNISIIFVWLIERARKRKLDELEKGTPA